MAAGAANAARRRPGQKPALGSPATVGPRPARLRPVHGVASAAPAPCAAPTGPQPLDKTWPPPNELDPILRRRHSLPRCPLPEGRRQVRGGQEPHRQPPPARSPAVWSRRRQIYIARQDGGELLKSQRGRMSDVTTSGITPYMCYTRPVKGDC
eukprot:365999-Chlamydomonas_euryale.AAC.13